MGFSSISITVLTLYRVAVHTICFATSSSCHSAWAHQHITALQIHNCFYEVRLVGPENSGEFNIFSKA